MAVLRRRMETTFDNRDKDERIRQLEAENSVLRQRIKELTQERH